MDDIPYPSTDVVLEYRVIVALLFSRSEDATDFILGCLKEEDFYACGALFKHLEAVWRAKRFATGFQRAYSLRRFSCGLSDSGERDAMWYWMKAALRWPCEFTYEEDCAMLRKNRLRRLEWKIAMSIRARAMNAKRTPYAILVEGMRMLDELAELANASEAVLKGLPRGENPYAQQ